MPGKNRYRSTAAPRTLAEMFPGPGPCVFVSYQAADREAAKAIAAFIAAVGVDVWFDQADSALQSAVAAGDDLAIAASINAGIENSTHTVAVISRQSRTSWWVPYEVGFARHAKHGLGVVVLRNCDLADLPSCLKIADVLATMERLASWLSKTGEAGAPPLNERRDVEMALRAHVRA